MKKKQKKLEEVIYVSWEESERGWGTSPDGCSLHLTIEDSKVFKKKYWAKMPDEVPDVYSRPAGKPVKAYATGALYKMIKESDVGIRVWDFWEREAAEDGQLVYSSERSGWVAINRKVK